MGCLALSPLACMPRQHPTPLLGNTACLMPHGTHSFCRTPKKPRPLHMCCLRIHMQACKQARPAHPSCRAVGLQLSGAHSPGQHPNTKPALSWILAFQRADQLIQPQQQLAVQAVLLSSASAWALPTRKTNEHTLATVLYVRATEQVQCLPCAALDNYLVRQVRWCARAKPVPGMKRRAARSALCTLHRFPE